MDHTLTRPVRFTLALTALALALTLCLAVSASAAPPGWDQYEVLEDGTAVRHIEGAAASLMAETKQDADLPQLSKPTDLEWGKTYQTGADGTQTWSKLPGMASWAQGAVGQSEYSVDFYRKDPSGPVRIAHTDLSLSSSHIQEGYVSCSEAFLLNARKTGDYYFEVRALGDGVRYRDSDPAQSQPWHFTDPGVRIPTPNPVWDAKPGDGGAPVLRFAGGSDSQILARRVQIQYASDLTGTKPTYGLATLYGSTSAYTLSGKMLGFGVGYYGASLQYLSRDCEQVQSSELSPLSPLIYYSGFFGKPLEELAGSVDETSPAEDIRDAVRTVGNLDAAQLAKAMMDDKENEGAAGQIKALEALAKNDAAVAVTPAMADFFDGSKAEITGAGLNADPGESVTLEIGESEEETGVLPVLYNVVPFSIRLTDGEGNDLPLRNGELAVPVKLTLPISKTITLNSLTIRHTCPDGTVEELSSNRGLTITWSRDKYEPNYVTFMVRSPGSYRLEARTSLTVYPDSSGSGIHVTMGVNPRGREDLSAALAVYNEDGKQIGLSLLSLDGMDKMDEINTVVRCDGNEARLLRMMILDSSRPAESPRSLPITPAQKQ